MNAISDYIVSALLDAFLSQVKTILKEKKKYDAFERRLTQILSKIENEPYYNTLSKIIIDGSLANQIIFYCEHVRASGKSIEAFCDDVVAGCKIRTADKSQVNGAIFKIAACFFNIINNPEDSNIRQAINILLESNAGDFESIRALLIKILSLIEKGLKPKEIALDIPTFINKPNQKNEHFSNREEILENLQAGFAAGDRMQYLTGMSGIGKTQIALEFAFRHEGDYDHIFWVNTETETTLLESYQQFSSALQLLSIPKEKQTGERIIQSVLQWLDTHESWLIVFDNAADIASDSPWWPKCNHGHCLITTQKSDLPVGKKHIIVEFLPEEAVHFLKKRTGKQELDSMAAVAKRLGYHPLALEQAAAYIANNKLTTFASYLQLLTDHGLTTLEETKDKDITYYRKSVTTTMEIAIAKIEMEEARQLLYLCSYLAPENIDPALFQQNAGLLPDPLQTQFMDDLQKNRVWRALTEYSLLEARKGKAGYSMHRLLQEVIRRQIGEDRQWARYCLNLLGAVFDLEYGKTKSHETFIKLLPHVEAFAENIASYFVEEEDQKKLTTLYARGGLGLDYLGNYAQALSWDQKALAISEKVLGTEHPDTATIYNNIGEVYRAQGSYPLALEWYRKALAIREKAPDTDHPNTATTYNNIALVYKAQGDYPLALEWYRKALGIIEKVLGTDHPDTATTYNNIALVYQVQGDYPLALEWYQKALGIREKALGTDHPDTAATYNNIASVYQAQGDYPLALKWYQKDLAISEKVLGTDHPDTATTYNNIAVVYKAQGDYPLAQKWHQKALAIREKVLGTDHPDTATTYNNIALVYHAQGAFDEALQWSLKDLEICEKRLGPNHPDTAIAYGTIAQIYTGKNQISDAIHYMQKAYDVFQATLDDNHPYTKQAKSFLQWLSER